MIPRECKRLAEVDFPIAQVSRHAAREKSIRHGHPSTLHLWWARRPLASSRAVLLALLLPDPCDEHCPPAFKKAARPLLDLVGCDKGPTDANLREGLLKFIGDFANWDQAAKPAYLEASRALVRAAHDGEPPLVVDPFAGGGSIPLEALRLGCDAFASDLNPVACLILKVMLEDIPRHGAGLADELRRVGAEIKRKAEAELAHLYPLGDAGETPITYLWARTVRCESPNCGAEIPLMRSFWLCKKKHKKVALRPRIGGEPAASSSVEFEIFEPETDADVRPGTVKQAKATCLCCHSTLSPSRVRFQLAAQRGGAEATFDDNGARTGGARMTAVVSVRAGQLGRHYRLPTEQDYAAIQTAQRDLGKITRQWQRRGESASSPVPLEEMNSTRPSPNARGLSAVTRYGMTAFGDLFTARQNKALATFADLVQHKCVDAVRECMALVTSRCTHQMSHVSRWNVVGEKVEGTFSRQAVPMVWDFAETNPIGKATGSFDGALDWVAKVIDGWPGSDAGQTQQADAANHPLPSEAAGIWFTDPPYYDAIPYADLADYFFVWLKRMLPSASFGKMLEPANGLSPKQQECVWNQSYEVDGRPKDARFFEASISRSFLEGNRVLDPAGVGSVVFAHQSTEGWEVFLSGLIAGGWIVTASWPIATEMVSRIRARDNASLATSVHLVCRKRSDKAEAGDWAEVLRELPTRVGTWMERLQHEGVRGADLVFACIGPALEIYSRYTAVETAEGETVGLPAYLERVWEVVGRAALQQVLSATENQPDADLAGGLEEDARLTALFLWTMQSTESPIDPSPKKEPEDGKAAPTFSLPYDVVRRFAQPMGIDLETWQDRIISQKKGIVRLLPIAERAKPLFGDEGAGAATNWLTTPTDPQATLFPTPKPDVPLRQRRTTRTTPTDFEPTGTTTLDRIHAAMIFQSTGNTQALSTLIEAEQSRGPDFLRLSNALSALYPRESQEKRLLDAMLLAVPR